MTSTGSASYRRHFGIGIVEWKVMAMLAVEPGISGSRIAQVIGLNKAAVSRALKGLEKRGLVTSSVSSEHSGHRRLMLTSAGLALQSEAVSLAAERERVLLEGFSDDERQLLISFLKRMLTCVPALQKLAERF